MTPFSDDQIVEAHEHATEEKVDDGGNFNTLPLVLLFFFSGLIFFGGTYLNAFSAHFDPRIFNENAHPKAVGGPAPLDPVALGKKKYETLCITCHLPTGTGVPGSIPPLAGSEWVNGSEERMIRIIVNGLKGPITVKGEVFGAAPMPIFGPGPGGNNWSDRDIAAVATYVRQAFGNTAGPVEEAKVTDIRTKVGARPEWSEAELKSVP